MPRKAPARPATTSPRGTVPPQRKTTVTAGGLRRKTIYLLPEEWNAVEAAAMDKGVPESQIIRDATRAYLGLPPAPQPRPGPKPTV